MIVEWNAHMFSADTDAYPFHPDATYVPGSGLSAEPLAEYRERMDEHGIDRAVLVQPEPYGDDHSLVLDCVREDPERLRATSLFYPRDPEAPEKLHALVEEAGDLVVATRFHAHRGKEEYLDGFDDPGVRRLWDAAAEAGLIVELHIGPNYARGAAERIDDHPETPVLIDHLAEPHTGDPVEYADVLDLADRDNVYMKLSGLGHFADDGPLYESVRPFTRRVAGEFGPDRMVWGGDTPAVVDAHLGHWSEADRAKVKGGNVTRLVWG